MKYLSVCSGIEAATCAWKPLGWQAEAFSEIEKFPCKLLRHHYPNVPNLGDMTKFKEWNLGAIDLLVGGTPCQSFSGGAGGRPEGAAGNHFQVIAGTLNANGKAAGSATQQDAETGMLVIKNDSLGFSVSSFGGYEQNIGTLRSSGGDLGGGSEMLISYGIQSNIIGRQDHNGGNGKGFSEEIAPTLTKADQHGVALSFSPQATASQGCRISEVVATLDKSKVQGVMQHSQVRRLTPLECERLQGFADGYTLISDKTADAPRYRALGNSMAVPVMKWIGERIQLVEDICN